MVERVERTGETLHLTKTELRAGDQLVNDPVANPGEERIAKRLRGAAGKLMEAVSDTSPERRLLQRFKHQEESEKQMEKPVREHKKHEVGL